MNMREMMAAMSGRAGDTSSARPDMRAQRLELLGRFERYGEPHEFAPGQLVVEKDGLGIINQSNGGRALIFWRHLEPSDAVDASIIEAANLGRFQSRIDCLVATAETGNDGTAAILFAAHDSARLRPLTAEERAELDAVRGDGA